MATSFDGIGMSQLGSERRFMTGDNPISQGLRGLKDFAILTAMDKSGLVGALNEMGQSKKDMMGKYPGLVPDGASKPPAAQTQAVPPVTAIESANPPQNSNNLFGGDLFKDATQQPQKSIEDAADEAMGLSKSTSYTTPNQFNVADNQSQDVLNRANQPVAPPGGMVGQDARKKESGGGGLDIIMKILPMLFGIPA
jgi:hypothetical protein